MYKLTLTHSERSAIDWVGDRYATGWEFARLLRRECKATPDDADWDDPRDIKFFIPEHVAWQINDLFAEEDYLFPCFSEEFKNKLLEFSDKIV